MEDFGNKGLREGSADSGSSRGEPLKLILKKSSYKPPNFVGADGLIRDAGIDSVVPLNMEGSPSLGQIRVLMAPLVTVRVFRSVESEVSQPEEGNAMPFIGMNEPAISEAAVRSAAAVDIINTSMADGVDGKNWTCGKDVTEDVTCVNNGTQVDARANGTFVGTIIRAMQAILASSSEVPSVLEFLQRRKLEAKKEVAASEFSHLNHSLSHRPVSVKPDISKPDISKASSAGGKLHILKPSCERNGITPTPKESLSPTSGSKVPNSPLTGESNLLIVKASAD
ncbi:hypothetical protein Tco_0956741 [Tanacetum coccineum]